uniref:Tr-type G domain-containing protein n=1 Tax=Pyramimonas obovata TaxID=1411642 RepID=A0A7S0RUZ7_9CHLO|mmetsp:Transcript_7176/g.14563  ORF Transcript_7176/g.14563 Transcript_7176/m.14563 type:complete len:662 (+) Transcript_7176:307-2292(+)
MAEVTTRRNTDNNDPLKNMRKHDGNTCGQEAKRVTSGPTSPVMEASGPNGLDKKLCRDIDISALTSLMEHLPPENDDGNHEYKRQLVEPEPSRFQELVTQMKYRLAEGQGEALYEVGVEDDGTVRGLTPEDLEKSLETLFAMAKEVDAVATVVMERTGPLGKAATVLVRAQPSEAEHVEIRVAICGNVDSGKSTLLGVLTKGVLDNGRGGARLQVFRHKHEVDSGRTSAISQQVLGFSPTGEVLNYGDGLDVHHRSWGDIVNQSSKVLAFFDLAGHERYFKTTLFGLTGHLPDYAMLLVDSNRGGIIGMTREHLGICLALKVPVFVVITKTDVCSAHVMEQTVQALFKLLKRPGVRKLPVLVRTAEDVMSASRAISSGAVVPIFLASCVTGESLDLLRSFLNHLPARKEWLEAQGSPARLHIDDSYTVQGVGTVVTGTLMAGRVSQGTSMLLGPDTNGQFKEVQVKSVRNKRVPVKSSTAGQTVAVALKCKHAREALKRHDVRKGMVLVDRALNPEAVWFFVAEVVILVHPTTMRVGYTPVIHTVTVRQAARLEMIGDHEVLRTGDRAKVTFQFLYRPEFLVLGSHLVFREGRTKGIGTIVEVQPGVKPSKPYWKNHSSHLLKKSPPTQNQELHCEHAALKRGEWDGDRLRRAAACGTHLA